MAELCGYTGPHQLCGLHMRHLIPAFLCPDPARGLTKVSVSRCAEYLMSHCSMSQDVSLAIVSKSCSSIVYGCCCSAVSECCLFVVCRCLSIVCRCLSIVSECCASECCLSNVYRCLSTVHKPPMFVHCVQMLFVHCNLYQNAVCPLYADVVCPLCTDAVCPL